MIRSPFSNLDGPSTTLGRAVLRTALLCGTALSVASGCLDDARIVEVLPFDVADGAVKLDGGDPGDDATSAASDDATSAASDDIDAQSSQTTPDGGSFEVSDDETTGTETDTLDTQPSSLDAATSETPPTDSESSSSLPAPDAALPPFLDAGEPPRAEAGAAPSLDAGDPAPPLLDSGTPPEPSLDAGDTESTLPEPTLDSGIGPVLDSAVPCEGAGCPPEPCPAAGCAPGAACEQDSECRSDNCVSELCAPGYQGASCGSPDDCHSGVCDLGSCTPGYVNTVCQSNGDCYSEDCGNADVCEPGLPGAPCQAPADCSTGLCNAQTLACDAEPLELESTTPADGATGVSPSTNLTFVFSEDVALGSGSIEIRNANNSLFEAIPVNDPRVTLDGETVVVNPSGVLGVLTSYYVLVDAGAFQSVAGGLYAGMSDPTAFNFTTLLL